MRPSHPPAHARRLHRGIAVSVVFGAVGCGSSAGEGACALDDADGIIGGNYTFVVTVDDATFTPIILKVQNSATVAVSFMNAGTTPHGFAIDCIPTPNDDGCPEKACFPDTSRIDPLEPGASAQATFVAPRVEGIYTFRSGAPGDAQTGQFVVQ